MNQHAKKLEMLKQKVHESDLFDEMEKGNIVAYMQKWQREDKAMHEFLDALKAKFAKIEPLLIELGLS